MALTNVQEFTLGIDQFVEKTEEERKNITKAVTLRGLRGVVFGTRVDKGRARGNWQVGESESPVGYDPLVYDAAGSGVDGGRVRDPIQEGSAEILNASGADIIWLHNGVPYIEILEGWDKMVAGTYESLVTWLRSQR